MKGKIEVEQAREIGVNPDGSKIYLGTYKHPRKILMEEVITVQEKEGKLIMKVDGKDDLAGEYEVILK